MVFLAYPLLLDSFEGIVERKDFRKYGDLLATRERRLHAATIHLVYFQRKCSCIRS